VGAGQSSKAGVTLGGRPPVRKDSDFWAITTYFNPVGYSRRRANYRVFRERFVDLPLITIELSYGPTFDLGDGDSDLLIQLRGDDVLWQKERLLNVALRALPDGCRKVAWVDCDVIFGSAGWAERADRLLDSAPIVHLFSRVHYMPRDLPASEVSADTGEVHRTSIAFAAKSGSDVGQCLDEANHHFYGQYSPGFAWAARRDLLEAHGFYDGCIVGGGDRATVCADFGCFDHVINRHCMNDPEVSYYVAWAQAFHGAVRKSVGCVEGDIFHLWHGALQNRGMRERHQGLHRFAYDPGTDLAVAPNGVWRWNSDKRDMHEYVRGYFASRKEEMGRLVERSG
jgi:hypothetical protein